MFKKAQAAMEFLMTYGWAILVVLAAIAALAYFGVLSPDRFLPEKCTMPSGVACLDFSSTVVGATAAPGTITISLQNAAGFDMKTTTATLSSVDATLGCTPDDGNTTAGTLNNGVKDMYQIYCTTLPPTGSKLKAVLTMNYVNSETNLPHSKVGELILKMP